ncbi:MAG: hypothetical protein K0U12_01170, partial [Gammaproteobacteria bacterium]|nr:hypothetical protein [Gammaproteobacteria bacterium]
MSRRTRSSDSGSNSGLKSKSRIPPHLRKKYEKQGSNSQATSSTAEASASEFKDTLRSHHQLVKDFLTYANILSAAYHAGLQARERTVDKKPRDFEVGFEQFLEQATQEIKETALNISQQLGKKLNEYGLVESYQTLVLGCLIPEPAKPNSTPVNRQDTPVLGQGIFQAQAGLAQLYRLATTNLKNKQKTLSSTKDSIEQFVNAA